MNCLTLVSEHLVDFEDLPYSVKIVKYGSLVNLTK